MFAFLTKIWDWIKENLWIILLIIIVVICIWFPYLIPVIWNWILTNAAALGSWIAELGISGAMSLAGFALTIFDPEGAGALLEGAGTGVGNLISGVLGTILSSPAGLLIAGGVAAYFLWPDSDDSDEKGSQESAQLYDTAYRRRSERERSYGDDDSGYLVNKVV